MHYLAQNYNQSDLTIDNASIFQPMHYPQQVSEGSQLLPVADGGACQDQLNLVDVLRGCLGLPLLLLLGREQVHDGRVRQALKRNRAVKKASFISLWVVVFDLTRPNPDTEISSIFQ